ncbi:hypothetical protein SOVF_094830 [Spinacia oleracea]|nr:hypothetical protein SOVF_094830 [Spinacia oleracea]
MKRRVRFHSLRTQRFSKYLKPGALARLRDSRIHSQLLTHRVTLITRSAPPPLTTANQPNSPSPQTELMPEFLSLDRGPQCFGRKKLAAAKSAFITSVNPVPEPANLLVH